jgi:c-di-GMP-binding flagellar brake protein YcgR
VERVEHSRREHYRVNVDELADLRVAILEPGGEPVPGMLVDVSGSGAGVRFTGPYAPKLAVGQEVDLVFTSKHLGPPMTVAARVQHRTEEGGGRRFGLRFLEAHSLEAYLPPVMREYFNRRQTVRVTPDPARPVGVELRREPESAPFEAGLVNVSVNGAAVSILPSAEAEFVDADALWITLYLPTSRRPVSMYGHIRYRRLVKESIHYGLDFDAEESPDFARKQAILTKYVLKREMKLLRKSA